MKVTYSLGYNMKIQALENVTALHHIREPAMQSPCRAKLSGMYMRVHAPRQVSCATSCFGLAWFSRHGRRCFVLTY
eukprot:365187-Chlamydomonas_euryale.AAC.25